MAYGSFEELEVWQRACRLSIEIINLMRNCREWALRDQMMKASLSIPSNIAEGAERGSIADFIRFLHIAKGSAAELRTQLFIVRNLGDILPETKCQEFIEEAKRIKHASIVDQVPPKIKFNQRAIFNDRIPYLKPKT